MYRAMVLRSHAPVESKPLKMEKLGDIHASGQRVVVKILACGVCHSDVHIAEGKIFGGVRLPVILGHEIVGDVVEAGKGLPVRVGDRVGIGWMHSSCLSCKHCKQGRENICVKMESVGRSVDGGYAEYGRFDSRFLTKVPRKMDPFQVAPLFCAGLTAYRAVKRVAPKKGENVAVVGVGGLGGYAIQFAKMSGANVYAFSRGEERLRLAKKLGAKQAIDSTEGLVEKMSDIGIEVALVFAPSAHVLEQALLGLEKGGRILMGGNIEKTKEMDYRKALAYEKIITTVSVGTRQDMRELIDLAAKGKVRSQVSEVLLEDANEALASVKSGAVVGRIVLSCVK